MREDVSMKKLPADRYPGMTPPRRRRGISLFTAVLVAIGITCFGLALVPVVLAFALINAAAQMFAGIGLLFSTVSLVVGVLSTLFELLWLLQTAQPVQFVMRVLQALSK
jgi:hypothetical protein